MSNAEESYPVLVFACGLTGIPENWTTQMEELASHGYVIAGIVEPYMSGVTIFPDGRLVKGDGSLRTDIAVDDISFVLDQLEVLNTSNDLFAGRLDLEHVGAFGASRGGNAVVIAAERDDRIQAVLSEDGGVPIDGQYAFLLFTTGPQTPGGGDYYIVWVEGFTHYSFTEMHIAPNFWAMNIWFGSVDGARTGVIIRAYVLAFFDKHLKGRTDTLLDNPSSDFPEVQIRSEKLE